MNRPLLRKIQGIALAGFLTVMLSSCAVLALGEPQSLEPVVPPAPPIVPGYAGLPHPLGLQQTDVLAIFQGAEAPRRDAAEMQGCDEDYLTLEKKTKAREELKQGILELVRKEPIRYHWCFYSKILELEAELQKNPLLDEKQKKVVGAYRFLAPLARAFYREFSDSRYLRWAVSYYRRASELAFYRSVEASPSLTQELVGIGKDDPTRGIAEQSTSVLEKYGILVPERLQPGQRIDEKSAGEVLPGDAYLNTGSGVQDAVAEVPTPSGTQEEVWPVSESAGDSVFPAQNP